MDTLKPAPVTIRVCNPLFRKMAANPFLLTKIHFTELWYRASNIEVFFLKVLNIENFFKKT